MTITIEEKMSAYISMPVIFLILAGSQKGRRESEKAAALATEAGWGAKHRWPLFLALLGNLNAVSGNYFRNQHGLGKLTGRKKLRGRHGDE
ncbi:MAG TPA: hypothetical protein VM822_10680 [Pseudolabrys sp.]|nr:hypothetical protein [Pseudolabrys sp.]